MYRGIIDSNVLLPYRYHRMSKPNGGGTEYGTFQIKTNGGTNGGVQLDFENIDISTGGVQMMILRVSKFQQGGGYKLGVQVGF